MIRAHRVAATAQDNTSLIAGYNIAPNESYVLALHPGTAGCVVMLYDSQDTLLASGVALVGEASPCVLAPRYGYTIDMVDPELGWHVLISTAGDEVPRTIRLGPAVDLPDEIHPIYADDDLAQVRATAAIDAAAHYIDQFTISLPLGAPAAIGRIVALEHEDAYVAGQVESMTWQGTPNGTTDTMVLHRYVPIAPGHFNEPVPPTPPVLADDAGETTADEITSGNVLTNDASGLAVVAVNGLSANVGVAVAGNNGGVFTIASTGAWTFDPSGDFAALTGSETAETSVTYHASDGIAEASATLTVTVSSGAAPVLWTPADVTTALWLDASDSSTITLNDSTVSEWRDKSGNARHATQGTTGKQPVRGTNWLAFDGSDDEMQLANITTLNYVNATVFVVGKRDNSAGRTEMSFAIGNATDGNGICDTPKWTDNVMYSQVGRNANRPTPTSVITDAIYQNAVTGGVQQKSYTHGTLRGTGSTQSTSNYSVASGWVGSGRSHSASIRYFDGNEYEIIIEPSVLSDAARQIREGYLAHKWDALLGVTTLRDALPPGHPYKSAPPTL